jgi:hypothetical protein
MFFEVHGSHAHPSPVVLIRGGAGLVAAGCMHRRMHILAGGTQIWCNPSRRRRHPCRTASSWQAAGQLGAAFSRPRACLDSKLGSAHRLKYCLQIFDFHGLKLHSNQVLQRQSSVQEYNATTPLAQNAPV